MRLLRLRGADNLYFHYSLSPFWGFSSGSSTLTGATGAIRVFSGAFIGAALGAQYLPSHSPEGELSGLSESRALALCRRLVAVHCLYGVDKNPLAVELAKLALWLESYAEGLPLTFMDHRLICGDSLTGPFFEHLLQDNP